jgi:dihydroorotate dehydrogenase (fumarate)/dihydroorotate dehydrogenase
MDFYRSCVRPLLFRFDPEWLHARTLRTARAAGRSRVVRETLSRLYGLEDPRLRQRLAGLTFPNPVGLPGGFDKNGVAVSAISTVGFGFLEVGSVSLHPSAGNPERPRLFRLPLDESLRVFYGVPNDGCEAVARRLAGVRLAVPLGINLVETNTGKPALADDVIEEIVQSYRPFQGLTDYVVINMSCPNSGGGVSPLDEPRNLARLLEGFRRYGSLPPMFLKMHFPPEPRLIDALLEAVDPYGFVKGFMPGADNKVTPALRTPPEVLARSRGSITGPHKRASANETMRIWYPRIDRSRHILVGAGGICSAEDAYERIRLGASLVQVYTALVYRGPRLVRRIKQGLCALLERDGLTHISQAIGLDHALPPERTSPRTPAHARAA